MAAVTQSNELYLTRVYDAPVELVWSAWTDPKKLARWWGPRGFTLTTHSKELKPGGTWVFTMHGPDGVDYPNKTSYLEVEKYARLVYDHGAGDQTPPLFRVTVNFTETAGKTKMEMTMTLATAEAAGEIKKFIKKAGGDATWDRLAEYLAEESSGEDIFVINRAFEAPIDLMFEMFTEAKHFSRWLPPTGFTMSYLRTEIKQGGTSFYCMSGPGGMKMFGKAAYEEIVKPHRIVYTQYFCDENEKITRHPAVPGWPEAMGTTITFTAESPEKTCVTIKWQVAKTASALERETFTKSKGGMTQGWTGSFDKLESYLKGD